jgi:hypothetical protein
VFFPGRAYSAPAPFPVDKSSRHAKPGATRARRLGGKNQNIDDAIEALKNAAVECRATLTPHDVAISRRCRRGQEARCLHGFAQGHRRVGTSRYLRECSTRRALTIYKRFF